MLKNRHFMMSKVQYDLKLLTGNGFKNDAKIVT